MYQLRQQVGESHGVLPHLRMMDWPWSPSLVLPCALTSQALRFALWQRSQLLSQAKNPQNLQGHKLCIYSSYCGGMTPVTSGHLCMPEESDQTGSSFCLGPTCPVSGEGPQTQICIQNPEVPSESLKHCFGSSLCLQQPWGPGGLHGKPTQGTSRTCCSQFLGSERKFNIWDKLTVSNKGIPLFYPFPVGAVLTLEASYPRGFGRGFTHISPKMFTGTFLFPGLTCLSFSEIREKSLHRLDTTSNTDT